MKARQLVIGAHVAREVDKTQARRLSYYLIGVNVCGDIHKARKFGHADSERKRAHCENSQRTHIGSPFTVVLCMDL